MYIFLKLFSGLQLFFALLHQLFFPLSLQVIQLTGFSDPVYAEAYVNINQYDIVLDVLVVNQTGDTLQVGPWFTRVY